MPYGHERDQLELVVRPTPLLAVPQVEVEHRDDGTQVIRSATPLDPTPDTIFTWMDRWAVERPGAAFVTEPMPSGDRRVLTYGAASTEVERRASHLASRRVDVGDRVVVATPNSIQHLLWGFAAMRRGAVYVPMAPQYVAPNHDREKLHGVLELLDPALVICPSANADAVPSHWSSTDLDTLDTSLAMSAGGPVPPVPGPDDVAKILLTSGSTGLPKPVPYPHRLMTAAVTMTVQVWTFAQVDPPVILDWLPWNHAFGGTANLHLVLATGGTLHLDSGGPDPVGLEVTLADIPRVRPDLYCAVPATLDLLRARLEVDPGLARVFFGSVRTIFWAGAALSADTFHALHRIAESAGERVVVLNGWGSTECGPGATLLHVADAEPGWIGTPLPGVEIKLTPEGGKQHAAVRGPNVFPGYWGSSAPDVFDDEGFYRSGDAACLADPKRPDLGLRFDGRLGDDFKLANGTWVDYARVRSGLLAEFNGRVVDVVVGLPDGHGIVALAWAPDGELAKEFVTEALARYNAGAARPTDRVHALAALRTPPSANEVTLKGQLRPGELRRTRRDEFAELLAQGVTT